MLHFLPGIVKGCMMFVLYLTNTIFWFSFFFPVALFKVFLPIQINRTVCNWLLIKIAGFWIFMNSIFLFLIHKIKWEIEGLDNLKIQGWYLVISNHQSWVDILVLQKIFYGKIPFLKFFVKKELIWVPIMGLVWWGLEYPFMKRYSREFLRKNPHLKGKDIEITKKACEKFKYLPVSVMNFVEGTRFTKWKHEKQNSPFTHLLRPKAGGMALALSSMGEYLKKIVNVTIVYPGGVKSFWQFMCGEVREIRIKIDSFSISKDLLGDYANDPEFRENFQIWLNDLWAEKDQTITELLN